MEKITDKQQRIVIKAEAEKIAKAFNISYVRACKISIILNTNKKHTEDYIKRFNVIHPYYLKADKKLVVDKLLEGFGVEALNEPFTNSSNDLFAEYINMGDSYSTTIIFHIDGSYEISSWADVVEEKEKELEDYVLDYYELYETKDNKVFIKSKDSKESFGVFENSRKAIEFALNELNL